MEASNSASKIRAKPTDLAMGETTRDLSKSRYHHTKSATNRTASQQARSSASLTMDGVLKVTKTAYPPVAVPIALASKDSLDRPRTYGSTLADSMQLPSLSRQFSHESVAL